MEIARMNYYFTGILILMLTALAFCAPPAHARNEYLNEYGVRCGEMEFRVEDRNNTQDYHTYNSSDYDNDSQSLWDDMKDEYKKENPEIKLMGDKFINSGKSKLKMPPKGYILPKPKPKDD